jgi:hypothetical protein
MKKLIMISLICLSLVGVTQAEESLKISGDTLGVLNSFSQKSKTRAQFDFAANLDIVYKLSDKLTGIVQLQGGTGSGSLGFVGPGLDVTDLNIEYAMDERTTVVIGSFDTPFGQEVSYLTNNAGASNHIFLSNSLLYSALAGPVGTLNTLGTKVDKATAYGNWTMSITNGTGENSINENNTFESLIAFTTDTLIKHVSTSITYIHSDDSADAEVENNNSFATDFSGLLVDGVYRVNESLLLKGYLGQLIYNDLDSSTDDTVQVGMIEAELKTKRLDYGLRVSAWNPESAHVPNPGYGISTTTYTHNNASSVIRYQFGTSKEIEKNLWLKTEVLVDNYAAAENVGGLLVYVNATF